MTEQNSSTLSGTGKSSYHSELGCYLIIWLMVLNFGQWW